MEAFAFYWLHVTFPANLKYLPSNLISLTSNLDLCGKCHVTSV